MLLDSDPRWQIPLAELVQQAAQAPAESVFVVDETGRSLTYRQLSRLCHEAARNLARMGIKAGTRVAWQLPTWIEAFVLSGALALLDTVQIPLQGSYREHDLAHAVQETEAHVFITTSSQRAGDRSAGIRAVQEGSPTTRCLIIDRSRLDSMDWFSDETEPIHPVEPARSFDPDVRWIFFTSGTTSRPKAVMHTDRSVAIPSITMTDRLSLTHIDRVAVSFPLGHIGGINWLIASLQTHCTLLLSERFDNDAIAFFDDQDVTLPGVSTVFHIAYRDYSRTHKPRKVFSNVRAFPGGAAIKPPSLQRELLHEIGGVGIVSGFGLTECPMISMLDINDPESKRAATEGRLSPGVKVEIRQHESLANQPPGISGEIWVKGPQLFRGYIDTDKPQSSFDINGYFRTGDIGYLDEEGYLNISGRLKEVIIRKGENISAKEVEDILFDHPAVAESAVIGLPDDSTGERCCAVLVPNSGHEALTVQAVSKYLKSYGLAPYKWPEQVEVLERLPRSGSGKILKHQLIAQFTDHNRDPDIYEISGA